MENNQIQNLEPTKIKKTNRNKEQFRLVINKAANESLEEIVKIVNSNFSCGEITKSNIAEWILSNLNGSLAKSEIRKIQEFYIDEKKMLQDLLKGSVSQGNELPEEIKKALKEHFGFSTKSKKAS